jgi:YD repeat-containing protein
VTNKDDNGIIINEYSYTYYLDGNMDTKTDSIGTTDYIYDSVGRLDTVTEPGNIITDYDYDAVGNRTSMTKTGFGTVTYNYDEFTDDGKMERITSINHPVDGTITYSYDDNGNQTMVTRNGISKTYTYDNLNRLTGV